MAKSNQKCIRCKATIEVWFSVILCDKCLDRQAEAAKLESQHRSLGEIGIIAGAISVEELEEIWRLK